MAYDTRAGLVQLRISNLVSWNYIGRGDLCHHFIGSKMKHRQILFIGAIGITGFLVWGIYHENSD
jgi:hypothetical protein